MLCSSSRVFHLRRLHRHFAFWRVHIGHNRLTYFTHQHVVLHRNILPALVTVVYEHTYEDGKPDLSERSQHEEQAGFGRTKPT